jgi:hypothetical protein
MKILLSWFDLNTDMEATPQSDVFGGPTLAAIRLRHFDRLYLFANSQDIFDKAQALKNYVQSKPGRYRVRQVDIIFIPIINPTDYRELWDTVPAKVEKILKQHCDPDPEVFINLSAGTPAMRSI